MKNNQNPAEKQDQSLIPLSDQQIYDWGNEPLVINQRLLSSIFNSGLPNPTDILGLYVFYWRAAKRQATNQPYAIDRFCKNGLHWGDARFRAAKKSLQELGLIRVIRGRASDGRIAKTYTKLKYIWSASKVQKLKENATTLETHTVEEPTQRDSVNKCLKETNINALKREREKDHSLSPSAISLPEDKSKIENLLKRFNLLGEKYPHINKAFLTNGREKRAREAINHPAFDLEKIMAETERSPYLQGESPARRGIGVGFDDIINVDMCVKILEGRYRPRLSKLGAQSPTICTGQVWEHKITHKRFYVCANSLDNAEKFAIKLIGSEEDSHDGVHPVDSNKLYCEYRLVPGEKVTLSQMELFGGIYNDLVGTYDLTPFRKLRGEPV